jgi:hypothetical protein
MYVSKPAACAAVGLSLSLVLLAGCGKSGGAANTASAGGNAAAGGPAAAAPARGPDVAIAAADLPHLKAGYWESTTVTTSATSNGAGPEVHRFCSSGKPIAPPSQMGHGCSTFSFKRTFLGAIVIDAACAEGPVASKLHMTASGDFNSTYTTDSQASIIVQGQPPSNFTTHSVARWVGPCPAGATPDDG